MSMILTLDPLLVYAALESQIYTAAAALFFNGICLLLFALAVYFLRQTKAVSGPLFLGVAGVLVAFALAHLIVDLKLASISSESMQAALGDVAYERTLAIGAHWASVYSARQALTVTNNAIADGVFLYRVYTIWSTSRFHKLVVGICSFLILVTMIMGYISCAIVSVSMNFPYGLALITNFVLLGVTAGRIWRKGRDVVLLLGPSAGARYTTAIAMICESSLLYVLTIFIYFISANTLNIRAPLPNLAWGALPQIFNIVPLMIIVRVGIARVFAERSAASSVASGGTSTPLVTKSGASAYSHSKEYSAASARPSDLEAGTAYEGGSASQSGRGAYVKVAEA
ncbi:hypothetical protein B0H15DRAFT_1022555 [Mycena belliarum]|uniref:Uncharacterized protein n=1 Tax=Mycena belliarum TaxID=1033014 RepID=A0AAD6XNV0_9AGAR|nr:hypothetical protein B0H15DRAFT_1022555 [Mycena belliae]